MRSRPHHPPVSQREVELILVRQLASYLTLPIFVVDLKGTLIYFNEPAEPFLGVRDDETGDLLLDEWVAALAPTDEQGAALEAGMLPLVRALKEQRPRSGRIWANGQPIDVTACPLSGQAGRDLGAVGLYWSKT